MRALRGTSMPASAASCCGVRPTEAGFIPPPGRNRARASAAFCSALTQWAPWRRICSRSSPAIGASAITACSVAQMVEQSKAFEFTMASAAAATSALRST